VTKENIMVVTSCDPPKKAAELRDDGTSQACLSRPVGRSDRDSAGVFRLRRWKHLRRAGSRAPVGFEMHDGKVLAVLFETVSLLAVHGPGGEYPIRQFHPRFCLAFIPQACSHP
jgi:hypothetical protein